MATEAAQGSSPGLAAIINNRDLHRIVLQEVQGGVMAFVFHREHSAFPEHDYFLPDWPTAKEFASEKWDVAPDAWTITAESPDS